MPTVAEVRTMLCDSAMERLGAECRKTGCGSASRMKCVDCPDNVDETDRKSVEAEVKKICGETKILKRRKDYDE